MALVVDSELAIAELGGDRAAYLEIVHLFLEQVEETMVAMETARQRGALGDVLALLHDCANSLGAVGAHAGMRRLRGLEEHLCRHPANVCLDEVAAARSECIGQVAHVLTDLVAKS